MKRTYIAIDLKSFYASVECRERGLDPLTTNLVVADAARTEKTICLAVSPSLKSMGVPGRARLFEVISVMRQVNARRRAEAGVGLKGESSDIEELAADPELKAGWITAVPRMALYMEYSSRIYDIYLNYVAAEDIHVYSIDEVFMDVTDYLPLYGMTPHQLARAIIDEVLAQTGITATVGIGPNLFLCKIAMDLEAKHCPPDEDGVRIAELDEMSYRRSLWEHQPLTDFWRVGPGYARKLASVGLYTMGDVARCSLGAPGEFYNEDLLYRLFGVNAELLIDHAWGWEPCTIADIKAYRPRTESVGTGQVLQSAYEGEKARLVAWEMADQLALDLVSRGLTTDQIVLNVGYDIENLQNPVLRAAYKGPVTTDHYGRQVPKAAHGTISLGDATSSTKDILEASMTLYDRIVDPQLLVRRITITAGHVAPEQTEPPAPEPEQLDMFTDYAAREEEARQRQAERSREKKVQKTILEIKGKFGKNAILKGANLEEGATAQSRNKQIGGHKA